MYININACNNVLMHLLIIKTNYNISIMIRSSPFTIVTLHILEDQCHFHQFQEIDNKAFKSIHDNCCINAKCYNMAHLAH